MKAKSLCSVCGKNDAKGVYASKIAPVSLAYCESCMHKGAEAYNIVVTTAAIFKSENAEFESEQSLQETLAATLEVTGHTIEEFNQDVENEVQKFLETRKNSSLNKI